MATPKYLIAAATARAGVCHDDMAAHASGVYRTGFDVAQLLGITFLPFLACLPACSMKLERILWSSKPAALPLTVYTMLSHDRLSMLQDQCESYRGPLSAAVYVSMIQQGGQRLSAVNQAFVDEVSDDLQHLFDK